MMKPYVEGIMGRGIARGSKRKAKTPPQRPPPHPKSTPIILAIEVLDMGIAVI